MSKDLAAVICLYMVIPSYQVPSLWIDADTIKTNHAVNNAKVFRYRLIVKFFIDTDRTVRYSHDIVNVDKNLNN